MYSRDTDNRVLACLGAVATAVAVNAPAVRLIATSRWLIVAEQQVNRNQRLLVNVAETWFSV